MNTTGSILIIIAGHVFGNVQNETLCALKCIVTCHWFHQVRILFAVVAQTASCSTDQCFIATTLQLRQRLFAQEPSRSIPDDRVRLWKERKGVTHAKDLKPGRVCHKVERGSNHTSKDRTSLDSQSCTSYFSYILLVLEREKAAGTVSHWHILFLDNHH